MIKEDNKRLEAFLEREKIDCTVLLSEWDEICTDSVSKREDGIPQSSEEHRMYSIALENLDLQRRN